MQRDGRMAHLGLELETLLDPGDELAMSALPDVDWMPPPAI